MYNVLIVDDEVYAVEGLLKVLDWSGLGYSGIYYAYDADDALAIIRENNIDVMLCDIEMPDMNGLELADRVKERFPSIVTVFLTAHADFSYAQQAVRLGSFEYLLKPVDKEQLHKTMLKVQERLEELKKAEEFDKTYNNYVQLWEKQKPLLTERFWQDIFAQRLIPTPENLQQAKSSYNVTVNQNKKILPVLLSVELWSKEFNVRDEEIMEYALRNVATELFLQSLSGEVIQDRNGIHFLLIHMAEDKEIDKKEMLELCQAYIDACARLFYCSLSCYVGRPAAVSDIISSYHALLDMEANNIANMKVVRFQEDQEGGGGERLSSPVFIDWTDWAVLFELGKKDELLNRMDELLIRLQEQTITSETIDALYHTVIHMVYHVTHKRGWSVKNFIGSNKGLSPSSTPRSIAQFEVWASRVISSGIDYIHNNHSDSLALTKKIKQYVEAHVKEVTREDIATYVHLNPAYLSRFFKKETGQTLTDFIIQTKIAQIKIMLTESTLKISEICESMGYYNFSHFGKMFKSKVGIHPQEFRKRYQNTGE